MSLTSYLAAPPRDFVFSSHLRRRRRKLPDFRLGARPFLISFVFMPQNFLTRKQN